MTPTGRVILKTAAACLTATVLGASCARRDAKPFDPAACVATPRTPHLKPDYADVVLPPNIAPITFTIAEAGVRFRTEFRPESGPPLVVASDAADVAPPPRAWRRMLEANKGRAISITVCVEGEDDQWRRFTPVVNRVANEPVDRYVVYRLLKPLYNLYRRMGIYQRDLETYDETVILDNRSIGGACVNCHTFSPGHPDRMLLHIRGPYGADMVLAHDGEAHKVDTRQGSKRGPAAYSAWHPNGKLVAFSVNKLSLFYHAVGEVRDVYDKASDLAIYHVDTGAVTTSPQIASPDRLETFPTWSPDGRYLYFSSTTPKPIEQHRQIRYDLDRVAYDPDTDHWGEVERVLSAKDTGQTILEPRVSPDGKWLLFCMADWGNFPVYQPSSDLYVMDLATRQYHRLAVNSPRSESWHSWSSNSHWIVFASKRTTGVFGRLYLSYIDAQGHAHKPVLLPQRDPRFYETYLRNYNAPELTPTPCCAQGRTLARAARSRAESAETEAGQENAPWRP